MLNKVPEPAAPVPDPTNAGLGGASAVNMVIDQSFCVRNEGRELWSFSTKVQRFRRLEKLWSCLHGPRPKCCTGAGRFEYRQAAAPLDASLEERRRCPELEMSRGMGAGVVTQVARWVRWWTERWTRDLANERGEAATGRALVEIVCAHALRMRDARASIVRRKGVGFADRVRDPIALRNNRPDARKRRKVAVAKAAEKKRVATALRRAEAAQRRKQVKAAAMASSLSSSSSSSLSSSSPLASAVQTTATVLAAAPAGAAAAVAATMVRRSRVLKLQRSERQQRASASLPASSLVVAGTGSLAIPARTRARGAVGAPGIAPRNVSASARVAVASSSSSSLALSPSAEALAVAASLPLSSSTSEVAPVRPRARVATSAAPLQQVGVRISSVVPDSAGCVDATVPQRRGARRKLGESAAGL